MKVGLWSYVKTPFSFCVVFLLAFSAFSRWWCHRGAETHTWSCRWTDEWRVVIIVIYQPVVNLHPHHLEAYARIILEYLLTLSSEYGKLLSFTCESLPCGFIYRKFCKYISFWVEKLWSELYWEFMMPFGTGAVLNLRIDWRPTIWSTQPTYLLHIGTQKRRRKVRCLAKTKCH
jgi:hypothetical protein